MRLYLHSARCPVALRSFLDCNPNYWCFIPMPWYDAADEDLINLQSRRTRSSSLSASNKTSTTAASDRELISILAMGTIENERVALYREHVPLPPAAHMFSYQQRQKQRLFFEQFLSTPLQQQPYSVVDLCQMKIIAVRK